MDMIAQTLRLTAAIALASTIAACGGGSGGSSSPKPAPSPTNETVNLSGTAMKGLLANATVTAFSLDGSKTLLTTSTDVDGLYSLNGLATQDPILLELTTNEQTQAVCDSAIGCGDEISFGDRYGFNDSDFKLTSILASASVAQDQKLMITPITHMAAQRVVAQGVSSSVEITATLQSTAKLLGLDGININTLAPADITNSQSAATATKESQLYASLLASIATIAENDDTRDIGDVINELSNDFAQDGGLTGNSANDNKLTLSQIFEQSVIAIEKAEAHAAEQNIHLDMDFAETILETAKEEADQSAPDTEIDKPVDPVDPTDPVDPPATKEQAVAKGIALLEDLNTWEDALRTVEDQSITQPFVDQIEESELLLQGIEAQTTLLQNSYDIIGEHVSVEECGYYHAPEQCSYYESSTEFNSGPAIKGLELVAKFVQLTAFLDNHFAEEDLSTDKIYSYSLAKSDAGYGADTFNYVTVSGGDITITISQDETKPQQRNFLFNYAINRDSTTETVNAVLYTNEAADNNTIVVGISALDVNSVNTEFDNKNYMISDSTGEGLVSFETAEDRTAFVTALRNSDSISIDGLNTVVVALTTKTTMVNAHADITAVLSMLPQNNPDPEINDALVSVVTIDLKTSDSDESANLVVEGLANMNVSESLIDGKFVQKAFAKSAFASTDAIISAKSDNATIVFDGSIEANAGLLTAQDENGNFHPDNANAKFDGTLTLTSGDNTIQFTGKINAEGESVKTPDGIPFTLNGKKESFISKANLIGNLEVNNADGEAGIDVNLALVADIAGVDFVQPILPQEGDVIAQLSYGFEETDADNLKFFINHTDAAQQALSSLNQNGNTFEVKYISNSENVEFALSRQNCVATTDNTGQYCDLISTQKQLDGIEIASTATAQEIDDAIKQKLSENSSDNPLAAPDISLDLTAQPINISCDDGSCNVSASYSGTYEFPANITLKSSRQKYLSGIALPDHEERAAAIEIGECETQDASEQCAINITREHSVLVPTNSTPDVKALIAQGPFYQLDRFSYIDSCALSFNNMAACNVLFYNSSQFIYDVDVSGDTPATRIENLISEGLLNDPYGQAANGSIIESNFSRDPDTERFTANYEFLQTSKDFEVPVELVDFQGAPVGFPSSHAENYIRRVNGTPITNITQTTCQPGLDTCTVLSTVINSIVYNQTGLSNDQKTAIYLGRNTADNSFSLPEACEGDETSCNFSIQLSELVSIPGNISSEDAATYALSNVYGSEQRKFENPSLVSCSHNGYDDKQYCHYNNTLTITEPGSKFEANTTLLDIVLANYDDFSFPNYVNAHVSYTSSIADIEAYNDASYYGNAAAHFETSLVHALNIEVSDIYPTFEFIDYETADAYIEVSGNLVIDASMTGLEDSQISLFVERIGQEDAKGRVALSFGARTLAIELNSLAGFDNGELNNLSISNGIADMKIVANCADTDEEKIDQCDSGFNFEGDIFVDGFKIADLEDRDGIPVFKFDDGSDYQIVVTPNFIVNEL